MRRLALCLAVLALTIVGAGCGGGDEEASGTDTTTVTETTETTETATEETTTEAGTTDETDLSGLLADEDCAALVAAGASFAQAFAGGSATSDESTAALAELAEKVPEEIRADVQVLAEAYAKYAAELQDIGIGTGETPTAEQLAQLQQALASFDQQAVTAASTRLSAWANQNCPGAGG